MNTKQRQYLAEMGIDVWVKRDISNAIDMEPVPAESQTLQVPNTQTQADIEQVKASPENSISIKTMDWGELHKEVESCQRCSLSESRTQTVFGIGSQTARLMIVGEAPGEEEDRMGEPFVGKAGQLLNSMLAAIGLERKSVFIANTLKCCPPQNRDPHPLETSQCEPFLQRQINLLNPALILAVGRVPAQQLLGVSTPIGKLRGQTYTHENSGIPLVVTYHPAYLLRSPKEKRKSWDDLRTVKKLLDP